MGKVFGILLIVVAMWVGLTVFSQGTDAAFGGLFASSGKEVTERDGRPLTRRVQESVSNAYRENDERIESGTGE